MVIDLNADLGEGYGIWRLGDDEALLDVVTSANVACGFHAGDPLTIRRTCEAAVARGVRIGAQVSYRDLAGFGRREMEVDPEELRAEVLYQLAAVDGVARAVGGRVSYVKPHGALYNRACRDLEQAEAVAAAVADYDRGLPVLTLPGSAVHGAAARHGLVAVAEAFADRAYTAAGALVPRRSPGAVIHDPDAVAARAVRMATARAVVAADGSEVPVDARSICVHGDTPGAVRLARAVRDALVAAGVALEAFT
ncbi:LamB/YcsF family protein [Planomonospora sp. ID82291]|uniref:LamB/YcsF family protein n=1 Tax=Planomonospora sp. ID82291 TaxID=2738136 RepID=UPI0018C3C0D0|nr:5-oxoprolinase subunit PxpA [Planomonospora sp. ID82291]MBG0812713.1 LamB/YcsF family protein [Planomonospora sp. ID82291]